PLLKLHGSLNWGVCKSCKIIVPLPLASYLSDGSRDDLWAVKSVQLPVSRSLSQVTHHDQSVGGPLIVPPTWGKTSSYLGLPYIWGRAARELASAENIIVIGYSLPPSDSFFRYLYALGTISRTRIRRFW